MIESTCKDFGPSSATADARVLRQAARVWRRAAVRRADRRDLLAELSAELTAAGTDGVPASAVTGADPERTLRAWADERGLSGRARRLGLVVPTALAGVAVGFALVAVMLYLGFTGSGVHIEPAYLVVGLYAVTGALAYLLAVACTFVTLHGARDPRAASTARWLPALLPAGAAVATTAGVGVAWVLGFTTETRTFAAVIAVVCAALVAATTGARYLATRPRAASEFSTAAA
ncbi:hypothetical protein [Rhodococcus sp. SGAir0479]|uniref:hypothetical protein n=1 Tax=Rhodococcus sp. SGAir0479 TaxID=2567884 RepID=UPI0010CD565F|nr:hypothetical protein [Rhodococcus sp. SGAir0479]QCQ90861.1 hypothetical protein E7742_06115 [Rhodococcus sp. SGAir0479]